MDAEKSNHTCLNILKKIGFDSILSNDPIEILDASHILLPGVGNFKKGMDNLANEIIANKIATTVVEDCGYFVELKGMEGIEEFQNDYLSIKN